MPTDVATVQLCRNAFCSRGASSQAGSANNEWVLAGDFFADARISADASGTSLTLTINGGNGSHQDGDTYSVAILDASGNQVFTGSKTVTYDLHKQTCDDNACRTLTTAFP